MFTPEIKFKAARILKEKFGNVNVAELPDQAKRDFFKLYEDTCKHIKFNFIDYYKPFEYQKRFHDAGGEEGNDQGFKNKQYRALIAANRTGKSIATVNETVYHLTGRYPDWWKGDRFPGPITAAAIGEDRDQIAKALQKKLVGTEDVRSPDGNVPAGMGTGAIRYQDIKLDSMLKDGAYLLQIQVQHYDDHGYPDGYSILYFRTYTQDIAKAEGNEVELVLFDEQPPDEVYGAYATRTAITQYQRTGIVLCSFVAFKDYTETVRKYWESRHDPEAYFFCISVGWDDIPEKDDWGWEFFPVDARKALAANYSTLEYDARVRGIPRMGSGMVFGMSERWDTITFNDRPSKTMLELLSFDFAVKRDKFVCSHLGYDQTEDVVYLLNQYIFRNKESPREVSEFLNGKHPGLLAIWPQDGGESGRYGMSVNTSLVEELRKHGMNMANDHWTNEDGSLSKKNGIDIIDIRTRSGRLLFQKDLVDLRVEFSNYRYEDNKTGTASRFKGDDDCIDSLRYGITRLLAGDGGTPGQLVNSTQAYFQNFKRHHKFSRNLQHRISTD